MENNDTKTFWSLINKYDEIKIPIIQRDYAQGREDSKTKDIRDRLLKDIFMSIYEKKTLELNFVYGNVDEKIFVPIDGQQRLTTLFLFQWYFALYSGRLEDFKSTFEKFKYEARSVAGDFCKKILELKKEVTEKENIIKAIKDNYWFSADYEDDATVKSMLVMIAAIHDKARNEYKDIASNVFEILTDEKCPICFNFMDLKNMGQTEEIYVRMNARGKLLTEFENFKARLKSYLQEKDEDFSEIFITSINGKWSNFFWKYRNNNPTIDGAMMSFFRFMMLNDYIINVRNLNRDEARQVIPKLRNEKDFEFTSRLFNDEFKNVDGIDSDQANVTIKTFDTIEKLLNIFCKIGAGQIEIKSPNGKNYIESDVFEKFGEKELYYPESIILYAEYAFLLKYGEQKGSTFPLDKEMKEKLTQWLRFIYNLVTNSSIEAENYFLCIRFIDRMRKSKSFEIFNCPGSIADMGESYKGSGFLERQFQEEIIKAKLMKNDNWRDIIIKAEDISLFNGQIFYLLDISNNDGKIIYKDFPDIEIMNYEADKFFTYLQLFLIIFGKKDTAIRKEFQEHGVFQRALLSFGDTSIGSSTIWHFQTSNNEFRELMRDNDKSKSDHLKNLLDAISYAIERKGLSLKDITQLDSNNDYTKKILQDIQYILEEIINRKVLPNDDWRKYLVEMPEIWKIDSGTKFKWGGGNSHNSRYFKWLDENNILLLWKTRIGSWQVEYYSYALYLKAIKRDYKVKYEMSTYKVSFTLKDGTNVFIMYMYENDDNSYKYIAHNESNEKICSTTEMEEMLNWIIDYISDNKQ